MVASLGGRPQHTGQTAMSTRLLIPSPDFLSQQQGRPIVSDGFGHPATHRVRPTMTNAISRTVTHQKTVTGGRGVRLA